MDSVSTLGYGLGYIGGSTIPLLIFLIMNAVGVPMLTCLGFIFGLTAVWWLVFSFPLLKNCEQTTGKPYAILRIASDRRYKDKDGNKLTDFISIKVRGPLAERCAEFAWKGCKLAASGDFETITFEDEPERQPGFLIKASEVEFLSPRKVEETAQELEDESVREVAA